MNNDINQKNNNDINQKNNEINQQNIDEIIKNSTSSSNKKNFSNKKKEEISIKNDKKDSNENDKNLKKLEKKIYLLKIELENEKDKFLRIFAEFENYKKRIEKEKLDFFKIINEQIIIDLIPVLDDFNRGIKELKKSEDEKILKGMSLIKEKFIRILKEKGLSKINIKKGDNFNTDFHEAITQIPIIKDELKGKIVKIIEDGYILNEKVIRHAKVIIGK